MNFFNIIKLFLQAEPLPKCERSVFSDEHQFAMYYLMYKIDYHRRILKKMSNHREQVNDKDFISDHRDLLMNLNVKIVELEGKLLDLINQAYTNDSSKHINLSEVYHTNFDLPEPSNEIKTMNDTGFITLSPDNFNEAWEVIESQMNMIGSPS